MVGGHFGFEQLVAADLTQRIQGAHLGLFRIWQARRHWTGWYEDDRQVGERQSANDQARHDLVAYAQHQGRIIGVVAERHGRRHGDDVA